MHKEIPTDQEFLNTINEKDEILDSKSRTEIHTLGLLHREIHVWIFDKNQNIFFQKRGSSKSSAGLFDASVGGHVDKGEDYLKAAIRELEEEAGISATAPDLVLLRKFRATSRDDTQKTINNFLRAIYIYKYPISEEKIKKEDKDISAGFEKFSTDFLSNVNDSNTALFDQYILTEEIPYVLQYINGKLN